jgi:non-specific protein-tyrosine kinase
MNWVVEELEKHADLVIFDSPALLAVPDALRLATLVDGVLLVVDASRTTREMVEKAAGRLRQVGANIVAGVFNRASVDQDIYKYTRHYQRNEKSLTNGFSSKLP